MAEKQGRGELQRTESYQYPAGHLGHLSDPQQKTLEQFKQLAQEKGAWTPSHDSEPASHDDETLLRYLRARKFIPADAYKQFKDTEDWRAENHIAKLYETIDIDEYESSRRLYPQWLGKRDKRGIPVYLFEIANLNGKAMAAYQSNDSPTLKKFESKVEPKMLRLFALYENLTTFVLPLCSTIPDRQHPETPVSQSCNIVDISGTSLMQFWKLKNHMQDASVLATAHYPETLDRIFLIGAPSFFPTVWGWVKRWFDPITVSKIFILSQKEVFPTLSKYMDVENIPKKYGGKLDYTFGDMPLIDEEISKALQWSTELKAGETRSIPTGPIKWRYNDKGELQAVAVGTSKGVQRNDVIATLPKEALSSLTGITLSAGRVGDGSGSATPKQDEVTPSAAAKDTPVLGKDPESSITPAATIPYRDNTQAPADKMSEPRTGTSETRDEQQSHTHAAGNNSDGTPAIARDGQGEKQAIIEPVTVGQAAKEHPLPDNSAPPTAIEQVQQTAGAALETATNAAQSALAAVGLAAKKEEEPAPAAAEKHDPKIDGMKGKNVEEFLRAQNMSATK